MKGKLPGGGMSETMLCHDSNLQRDVVFKTLKAGTSQKRILDELAALSAIRSDHVVQVLDVIRDSSGTIVGFIEEYVSGDDLSHANLNTFEDALPILLAISSGIADIHSHGRLHRDLKPDNMKIDVNGTLKIFDFGLSKSSGSGGTTNFYYSPGFTPPEAFKKNTVGLHEYSESVDVYAFGAIALWMLNNGKLPSCMEDLPAVAPDPPVDFTAISLSCPVTVSNILSKCLHPVPGERPAIHEVSRLLARELKKGTHRLTLTTDTEIHVIDAARHRIPIRFEGALVEISYDGYDFFVSNVAGDVSINNMRVQSGWLITGSVVIVLAGNGKRAFVTADASHPEISQ
ncbi:serine/threonine-protein kinase [Brevundimonas sp.]|uniref:serine/threonine-protein kinase n=1 Tax=Brevundimonas sp. TaxID=1871086 RepID=UPI0035AE389B